MSDARLNFNVSNRASQRVVIRATGNEVRFFGEPASAEISEDAVPDPVFFFASCANAGFFATRLDAPRESFSISEAVRHSVSNEIVWRAEMIDLDARACCVLANMLLARDLTDVSIVGPENERNEDSIEYPGFPPRLEALPFAVDHVVPARRFKDRLVKIEFANEPSDHDLDRVYALCDQWIQLLLLGAYPIEGERPSESGVVPDLAALIEPVVVELPITEAFLCDEAGFAPLVGGLARLHSDGLLVRGVTIR